MAEAEDSHPHLELTREEPVTERRTRPSGRARPEPANFDVHAGRLKERLQEARSALDEEVAGYDDRRLIKITLTEKVPADEVARVSRGIEIISQEDDTLVLAFATDAQLDNFEMRLATLARGGGVTYQNLMHALEDLDRWTPENRMGWALRQNGFPDEASFLLDVELWPLDRDAAARARRTFENWLAANEGEQLDVVTNPYLTLYRVRCDASLAEALLRYRDVRTVDLPPDVQMDFSLLQADVEQFGEVPAPPDDAPSVVVLDTGLATGHPMLAPAVGDAETFLQATTAADEHGHGTMVAGIALYDDVAACIQAGRFVPTLRLFSGRVLDDRNEGDPRLIQNQVEEAVAYFVGEYGCRVFNLAYGDLNKPYQGRRLTGLAVTLDALAKEHDVLFVVPAGNVDVGAVARHSSYPAYLNQHLAPLIDPAPALNALTVGSLARYDQSRQSAQHPHDPAYKPIARAGQPSPFTRAGPSVGGATKPDLVDYGGNYNTDVRSQHLGQQGVGELSTSREFASGRPFAQDVGTSFAAPHVAHTAAMLMGEFPNASSDLCRALLACHAEVPSACAILFPNEAEALRNVVGHGLVDRSALYHSLNRCVTLWAEGRIQNRRHHFYEVPIPREFWEGGRRERKLTVALAYRPPVRTTRIEYRAVGITFRLVQAASTAEVAATFNAATDRDSHPNIPERARGRDVTAQQRGRGTLQASTWTFKQPSPAVQEKSWFVRGSSSSLATTLLGEGTSLPSENRTR